MEEIKSYLNTIINGNNVEVLSQLPDNSVDLIFADPPYYLQLEQDLYRPNQSKVEGVFDKWDKFTSFQEYDEYTKAWLQDCKRVLKEDGAIWVIGSYHNIFRVGAIMQDLGFWFLNDIVWVKANPMPNFKGTRFNNAHETMIWASKNKQSKYTFNYKTMKAYNDDLQMRSDWFIPICTGRERIKVDGLKAHSTQKPIELLQRIILASSNVGDVILDPFMGSGTTGAVAKRLHRNFIGIEREPFYVEVARERILNVVPVDVELLNNEIERKPPRVPFGNLVEKELIKRGEKLYSKDKKHQSTVLANASIKIKGGFVGSIHKTCKRIIQQQAGNGWQFWHVKREGKLVALSKIRTDYIEKYLT